MKVKFSNNCSHALSARTARAAAGRERKKTPACVLCAVLAWSAGSARPGPRHPQPPSIIPYGQLAGQVYMRPPKPERTNGKNTKKILSYPI
jgi:hypothetical protein